MAVYLHAYWVERWLTRRSSRNDFWAFLASEGGVEPLGANSVLTPPKAL